MFPKKPEFFKTFALVGEVSKVRLEPVFWGIFVYAWIQCRDRCDPVINISEPNLNNL